MIPRDDERMSAERSDRLKRIASSMVRDWGRRNAAAITADVDAVGRSAVETSAREIARLPMQDGGGGSEGLTMLGVIVDAMEDPPRRRWSLLPRRPKPGTMTIPRLAGIIEHERDAAMRRAMTLQRDRLRLEAAREALEEALAMIPLLEAGAAAVAREVAVEDPVRASMLRTGVGSRLSARRQDLQQQLIVMRQASATLDLVADGQARLVEALDRARNITIGAAHTAVAARRVLSADAIPHDGRTVPITSLNGVVARLNAVVDRLERD